MDPEAFLDVANQVTKLKMYPYFDLAHSAVCLLAIREDLGTGEWLIEADARGEEVSPNIVFQVRFRLAANTHSPAGSPPWSWCLPAA